MAKQNDPRPIESYRVKRLLNGFEISHPQRETVTVTVDRKHMWRVHSKESWMDKHVNIMDFPKLMTAITYFIMYAWESPVPANEQKWWGARDWARNQVGKMLNKRVHKIWKDTVEHKYTRDQLALMRRVFSATYKHLPSSTLDYLFHETTSRQHKRYLIKDIMNHRAAAHALHFYAMTHGNTPITKDFNWHIFFDNWYPAGSRMKSARWKTLMSIPHAMSNHLLYFLKYVPIDRPITTKRQLSWICAMSKVKVERNVPASWGYFPKYTNDEDLGRAVTRYIEDVNDRYVGNGSSTMLTPNKCVSYRLLAEYIADGFLIDPVAMRGCTTVNALFKRAVDIHRQGRERRNQTYLKSRGYTMDTEVSALPIPFPQTQMDDRKITFLETVGDIYKEGDSMGHCVSSYAGYAVDGISYLFHAYFKGEQATVEVSNDGRVRQASGPNNHNNKAADYGRRVLSEWGKNFPLVEKKKFNIDDLVDAVAEIPY